MTEQRWRSSDPTRQLATLFAPQSRPRNPGLEVRSAYRNYGVVPSSTSLGSGADKLGRTTRIGNGSTPRRENREYWDGGDVPWLNSSVVNQRRVDSAVQFVTAAALSECHLPIVPPGSVLVGLTGQGKTRGMATILDVEATVNQHLAYVIPDRDKWWPGYLLWLLTSAYDDLRRISEENGSTKGGLTCEALKQLRVSIPPIDEQRAICCYLDRETARIDTLIEEQQRLIGMLWERRRAVCLTAVTRGVDESVELVESGDPAIGLMPAHWALRAVRHWLVSLDGRRIPLSAEERGDRKGEFDYYGASGVIDHVDDFIFDEPLVLVSEDGANLLARSTPIAFVAKGRYWVNNHAHVLRPIAGDVDFWARRLEALDVSIAVSGSAQPKLTAGAMMALLVSAPADIDEQRRIAKYLDEQTEKIDMLIEESERFIELAGERRSALITAAVAGQIDVREAV
ncbi:restriction endonuclease subunit S [Nocardiopsis exhalans]|uniref:Restriction endonuclease subunit S n=1 Tax=Nocardiopsis exhalans TaxID=163604 RepID=A0ABY5DBL6_9ACTN|nr:restriction endonuclease subunit S [Nocardiopsis exhalans]USY20739.1 restriction endonuclease subunit S [Nocardiopsis exhalans]